jgi:hypothetical protein
VKDDRVASGWKLSSGSEYVIDGNNVNKQLEAFNFEAVQPTSQLHHMMPGQVFDIIEKKYVKGIIEEIEKSKPQVVRFINLEALASGPHKDYLEPICGGLTVLINDLAAKNIQVTGSIKNPFVLPWNIVSKLDSNFKGLPAPGQTVPP